MTEWNFVTPTVLEGPVGDHRLFEFYRLNRAITIVRDDDGNYSQIRYPQDSELLTYPIVYRGGYNYVVDDATKQSLINGNVGVTESNFTAV